MITISLKMLMGEKTKYYGMISAISFSAFLILQQLGIFSGITQITSGFLNDITEPEIWVMHSKVKYIEDIKQLEENILYIETGISILNTLQEIAKNLHKSIIIVIHDSRIFKYADRILNMNDGKIKND